MTGAAHDRQQGSGRRRLARLAAFIVLPLAVCSPGEGSADWQFDPVLRAGFDYDDNATLSTRTDDEVELSGYLGEASLDMIYTSPTAYLSMRPIVRTRDYGKENDIWNADDQFFDLLGFWDGDKNSFRIFGDFSREAVRTAEIADADLDTEIDPEDISDDQTGFVNTSQRRNRYRLVPRWTYRFNEISSLQTEVSYLTTSYEDTVDAAALFDFTDINLRTQYQRTFSERSTAIFSLRARDYNSDRFAGDRQSIELSGGIARRVSPTTQFRAQVGIESIDQEDVGLPTTSIDPQPTFELALSRQLETIRFLAQYRRRVNASGRGVLTSRDELNLRFTRDLTERFSVGLGARAYTTDTISGVANTQDYVQIRGQVVWRISRSFSMQADYRHVVINREQFDGAADSTRFTLWLSWRPNPAGRDDRLKVQL
jgi:hypothetical protein